MMRLDKIIASTGILSRSEVKRMLRRVTVDGRPAKSCDEKLDPEKSLICVDGTPIDYRQFRYYMLNKPAGWLSATEDRRDRTVIELLPERLQNLGLFPAGRLDKDAEGLLLLTNDGELAHRIISPKSDVKKLYEVKTEAPFTANDAAAFAAGLVLGDGLHCLPALLEPTDGGALVTVSEGKFHQVKRMCAAVGKPVTYLKRLKIGGLELDPELKTGEYRELTPEELESIVIYR